MWEPASCPACGGMIVAEIDGDDHIITAYPKETGEWDVDHLPADVRTPWEEAVKVYRVVANASAVVACGRTLEAAADARGVTGKTLGGRVTKMQNKGSSRPSSRVPSATSGSSGTSGPMREGRCVGTAPRGPCVSLSRPCACCSRCPRNSTV